MKIFKSDSNVEKNNKTEVETQNKKGSRKLGAKLENRKSKSAGGSAS